MVNPNVPRFVFASFVGTSSRLYLFFWTPELALNGLYFNQLYRRTKTAQFALCLQPPAKKFLTASCEDTTTILIRLRQPLGICLCQ